MRILVIDDLPDVLNSLVNAVGKQRQRIKVTDPDRYERNKTNAKRMKALALWYSHLLSWRGGKVIGYDFAAGCERLDHDWVGGDAVFGVTYRTDEAILLAAAPSFKITKDLLSTFGRTIDVVLMDSNLHTPPFDRDAIHGVRLLREITESRLIPNAWRIAYSGNPDAIVQAGEHARDVDLFVTKMDAGTAEIQRAVMAREEHLKRRAQKLKGSGLPLKYAELLNSLDGDSLSHARSFGRLSLAERPLIIRRMAEAVKRLRNWLTALPDVRRWTDMRGEVARVCLFSESLETLMSRVPVEPAPADYYELIASPFSTCFACSVKEHFWYAPDPSNLRTCPVTSFEGWREQSKTYLFNEADEDLSVLHRLRKRLEDEGVDAKVVVSECGPMELFVPHEWLWPFCARLSGAGGVFKHPVKARARFRLGVFGRKAPVEDGNREGSIAKVALEIFYDYPLPSGVWPAAFDALKECFAVRHVYDCYVVSVVKGRARVMRVTEQQPEDIGEKLELWPGDFWSPLEDPAWLALNKTSGTGLVFVFETAVLTGLAK